MMTIVTRSHAKIFKKKTSIYATNFNLQVKQRRQHVTLIRIYTVK